MPKKRAQRKSLPCYEQLSIQYQRLLSAFILPVALYFTIVYIFEVLDKVLQRSHAYPIIFLLKIPKPKREDKSYRAETKPALLSPLQSFPHMSDLWTSTMFEPQSLISEKCIYPVLW